VKLGKIHVIPPLCFSKMKMRLIITVILFLGCLNSAQADYMDFHFDIKCDAKNNRAEIIPYGIWNSEVYSNKPQNCKLSNGRTIRVKMGLGSTYRFGIKGVPDKWLSVWIDKKRVLSRSQFDCDDKTCSMRVNVTAKGFTVCYQAESDKSTAKETPQQAKEQCKFTANKKFPKFRDSIEFPLPNQRKMPRPNSLVTLFAQNKQFCKQFKQSSKLYRRTSFPITPPESATFIDSNGLISAGHSSIYEEYIFDSNNDLKTETVVGLHSYDHRYRYGDIYFIYPDNKIPTVIINNHSFSESLYAKEAQRIIPYYWTDYSDKAERQLANNQDDGIRNGVYISKNLVAPWWNKKDKPNRFNLRYWHLLPFRYENATYFLTGSQEAYKQHWFIVLKPQPNYHVTEMCIFQTVQVRY
jgi:hypothetical protein